MINEHSLSQLFDLASFGVLAPIFLALFAALAFEFVNGFHDTSNAVATVIYTRALRPGSAVLISGVFNFIGVLAAGVGVAYSVVNLFPTEILLSQKMAGVSLSMVAAVLCSAILWNLGTWFLGIPASSSHTMIGAIVGASMGYAMSLGLPLESAVPWDRIRSVAAALFLSPVIGFAAAALLLLAMRLVLKDPRLYAEPEGDQPPPWWIRGLLIVTCGGVSFSHGSNDGQKGMGLIMLVLIGLLPAGFSLNLDASADERAQIALHCRQASQSLRGGGDQLEDAQISSQDSIAVLDAYLTGQVDDVQVAPVLASTLEKVARTLEHSVMDIPDKDRAAFRLTCELQARALRKFRAGQEPVLQSCAQALDNFVQYVSFWIKVAVALALGVGTMVGWKRVVVTVGEKIGKSHLSYAQGLTAQMVTTLTILLADTLKMPVSTTHVLSSGVAGSMYAQRSGLQGRTLGLILTAWILTLPVCVSLGMGLFLLFRHLLPML